MIAYRATRFLIAVAASVAIAAAPAVAQSAGTLALSSSTTVPFTLSGNHLFIRASVNGAPFAFVFDTGGAAALSPEAEKMLNLPAVGHANMGGAGAGITRVDVVNVAQLMVGDATYANGNFNVLPELALLSPFKGVPFGGLLGREVMHQAVVTIDYAHSQLTFTKPDAFTPAPGSVELPLTMYQGTLPSIPATIDGHAGVFNVDTGAASSLTLGQDFAARNNIASEFVTSIQAQVGRGVGGPVFGTIGRLKVLQFGSVSILNPIVSIASGNSGIFSQRSFEGNIGGEILRRFTLSVDVPDGKVYLLPNAALGDPFLYNRTGIAILPSGGGAWTVDSIVANSPGEAAGVQKGDVVTAIDGQSPAALGVDKVRDILRDPNRKSVVLTLARQGQVVPVTVRMRDLI